MMLHRHWLLILTLTISIHESITKSRHRKDKVHEKTTSNPDDVQAGLQLSLNSALQNKISAIDDVIADGESPDQ